MLQAIIINVLCVMAFAVQLVCCFKVRKKLLRCIPTFLFLFVAITSFALVLFVYNGWDGLGLLFLSIFAALLLLMCGGAWGVWGVCLLWKRLRKGTTMASLCEMLKKELLNNDYEYGFFIDGKKYKPDMSGFDEEYYRLSTTIYRVQDPLVTMKEKIGTCVEAVMVMKYLLDAKNVPNKIWLLYNRKKHKVHTVLTFDAEGKIVYLELTPQSSKEWYGKELVYGNEQEFLQGYEENGYEVSDVTDRVVVGEQPMFLLEMLG